MRDLVDELPFASDGVDASTCEADRQLEVGAREGLRAVCADLVERTKVQA